MSSSNSTNNASWFWTRAGYLRTQLGEQIWQLAGGDAPAPITLPGYLSGLITLLEGGGGGGLADNWVELLDDIGPSGQPEPASNQAGVDAGIALAGEVQDRFDSALDDLAGGAVVHESLDDAAGVAEAKCAEANEKAQQIFSALSGASPPDANAIARMDAALAAIGAYGDPPTGITDSAASLVSAIDPTGAGNPQPLSNSLSLCAAMLGDAVAFRDAVGATTMAGGYSGSASTDPLEDLFTWLATNLPQ